VERQMDKWVAKNAQWINTGHDAMADTNPPMDI